MSKEFSFGTARVFKWSREVSVNALIKACNSNVVFNFCPNCGERAECIAIIMAYGLNAALGLAAIVVAA